MAPSDMQVSAPGLTQDQLRGEQAWVEEFYKAVDLLDWSRWEKFWSDVAFFQFGNAPKYIGKQAVAGSFEEQLEYLELMHHEIIRLSFDAPLGLIYQTLLVTYRVKADPKGRTIEIPAVAVIHKAVGSKVLTGFEVYVDREPLLSVVQEVLQAHKGAA